MATQKKAATKKGIKVRDLKPAKDAKGGFARSSNVHTAQSARTIQGQTFSTPKGLN